MAICIAGMARSGTSLLAQLLHRCGVDFGPQEQLMKVTRLNAEGFWENLRFIDVNDRLLAAHGGSWYSPPVSTPALESDRALESAAAAVIGQFAGREPWAWKDPRNTLTLPFWKGVLPGVKIVVCVRHPAEASASLAVSGFFPRTVRTHWSVTGPGSAVHLRGRNVQPGFAPRLIEEARLMTSRSWRLRFLEDLSLELWRIYNERALEFTTGSERIVTHYDSHFIRPRAELERILAFLDIRVSAGVLDRHARTASTRLRHHRAASGAVSGNLQTLYERLCAEAEYAAGGTDAAD